MFECTICGLLSLGGSSCPACGSQIRVDLSQQDDDSSLPSEVPGLDDAVASWNELEGITPEEQPEPSEEPVVPAATSTLPFGYAGASNTNISRLPFGIGSYAGGMPFDGAEDALPLVSGKEQSEPSTPQTEDQVDEAQTSEPEPVVPHQPAPIYEPALVVPEPTPHTPATPLLTPTPPTPPPAPVTPIPVQPSLPPPSEAAQPQATTAPVRIEPMPLAPVVPNVHTTSTTTHLEAPMRLEAVPSESESIDSDVPAMWRIDAAPPDMDQIYAESEQVVEVIHTLESEPQVYSHEVASVDGGSFGSVISLDIHPAQALNVSLAGLPELEDTLQQGFNALGASSWAKAAIAFQKLASKMPGDAAVFNNYGLALLQRALTMAQSTDLEVQNLAMTQFESSILALREAAKSAPTEAVILINLAHALLVSGRAEKAIGLVQMHDQTHPQTTVSGNLHAAALVSMGESSAAKALLQRLGQDEIVRRNLDRLSY